ncbi:sensor histidine kinase [Sulfitobacter sp. S223]|uniref:histidine kinase dimerization/phosphoacceptor domain -containing protein n=1 Tax=Sulfitobacter sp. S223 TaxID=2867023 RepID=UPI0021A86EC7|nr:histidine kinase dimerization/phosphoacceptor domain -containing protein [Sulfitobacter sp. S223]UWR26647.1 sensor histidine kinase [Sulfitobacter sp. S223]
MTSGFLRNSFFGGLAFRVLLFLSLALLPIGLIAVQQTRQIAEQSQRTAELSLLAVTDQAAAVERTVLQEALGAGRALAAIVALARDDPARCSAFLKSYKEGTSQYRLVGYVQADGVMNCSSTGSQYKLNSSAVYKAVMERKEVMVSSVAKGAISGAAVVVVTVPLIEEGVMTGFVFISIDQNVLKDQEPEERDASPKALLIFNNVGEMIVAEQGAEVAQEELPAVYDLEQFSGTGRQVFTAQSVGGQQRVYALIPMLQDTVYAMSVWPIDTPLLKTDFSGRVSTLLPIVMWLASLVVAFWALNRLAIGHIRKLGRQMRHFALNRTLPRVPLGNRVPMEIQAMEASFLGMANSILQDEARLEDSLREKNILLKEVHHRVKNNLQLISSIMNMQIRQAPTDANRRVLQRLQDRILSLATVHKSMYQDNEMTRVNAGVLLREIVAQNLAVGMAPHSGIKLVEEYDDIMIGPDDAAPITLLVSEAVTNALKYVARNTSGKKQILVSLRYVGEERALLAIENTAAGDKVEGGTGLGSKLIQAFARQLNGTLSLQEDEDLYRLELDFPVPLTDKMAYDY